MTEPLIHARLELGPDGTPVSEQYGDVYHTAAGVHAQARYVFICGNGLPGRWQGCSEFSLLETGFGLGLNFMATWLAWRNDPQRSDSLQFISVEKHPFPTADLALAHRAWPEFSDLSEALCAAWPELLPGEHRVILDEGRVVLRLLFGDACEVMASLDASVDAIYLDGFSPAKNPELWSPAVCRQLARLAHPGTSLATWSVAGSVRRALAAAGFEVARCQGFAGKRQLLSGRYVGGDRFAETPFCDQGKKA